MPIIHKPIPHKYNHPMLADYNTDGYIIIKPFTSSEIEKLKSITMNIINSDAENLMKYTETVNGTKQLCRIEHYFPFNDELQRIILPKIEPIICKLFGEPGVLFKDKINLKLPGGNGFAPHQDAPAFATFGQKKHLSLMIPIDKVTTENGCLYVVKGDHLNGLFQLDEDYCNSAAWIPVELQPGDVLIFDSLLPHRSGPNKSQSSRIAHYLTYNARSDGDYYEAYYGDKLDRFPPEHLRVPGRDYSIGALIYNHANPID